MTTTTDTARGTTVATRRRSALYSAVIGLAALGVLLQGVWAGMFIREGQDNDSGWVEVHARGAEITLALAVIATIIAAVRLRSRREVLVGSIAFVVLLVVEAFIGGAVGDNPSLQVLHFPLAMALLGLAVWLPLRASRPVAAG